MNVNSVFPHFGLVTKPQYDAAFTCSSGGFFFPT